METVEELGFDRVDAQDQLSIGSRPGPQHRSDFLGRLHFPVALVFDVRMHEFHARSHAETDDG